MISIIVPVYNVEEYLEECIESITAQTCNDLELVLVDDGSTDKSAGICDIYAAKDSRIRVVHKQNGGLVSARKAGLKVARGEYIGFVDGDDYISPDMYEKLMLSLKENNADFVQCSAKRDSYEIKNEVIDFTNEVRHETFIRFYNDDIMHSLCFCLCKADLIRKAYNEVPDNMLYGEDAAGFMHMIALSGKAGFISDRLYTYRLREASISHRNSLYDFANVWKYCADYILQNDPYMDKQQLESLFENKIKKGINAPIIYYPGDFSALLDKRIVLYGAGKVGQSYWKTMQYYGRSNIVAWADEKYETLKPTDATVISPEEINKLTYDIVLVAVKAYKRYEDISVKLQKIGVDKDKIIYIKPKELKVIE